MKQDMMTKISENSKGQSTRILSLMVALLLTLAMVTSVAFADMGGDPSGKDSASQALRADANPSMDVALWYTGPDLTFINASRALRADANPSMDVALWYAPAEAGPENLLCSVEDLGVLCP
jgi:hypothetical protein